MSQSLTLIQRMSRENPLWGAPRIHGELLMLGIDVAESTVSRYMVRRRRPPSILRRAVMCLPKTLSWMTRGWEYGSEAADGRVSESRFTRRARLEAENLLLRQQLVVLQRKSPRRVRLWNIDRLLLVWLYRLYPSLLDAIIIVQPETVIRWHRRGFRAYWRWKSRHVGGRPRIDCEMRARVRTA